jgi:hypothetical protein
MKRPSDMPLYLAILTIACASAFGEIASLHRGDAPAGVALAAPYSFGLPVQPHDDAGSERTTRFRLLPRRGPRQFFNHLT